MPVSNPPTPTGNDTTRRDRWRGLPMRPNQGQSPKALPHPARGRKLSDRLVQPGNFPDHTSQAAVAAIAVFQGAFHDLTAIMQHANENPVLFSGTVQLDAFGLFTRNFDVLIQSVMVVNHGTISITIAPGGPMDPGRVPTVGAGVHMVGPGKSAVVSIQANAITVYGPAGASVGFAALSKWTPPSYDSVATGAVATTSSTTLAAVSAAPAIDLGQPRDTLVMTTQVTGGPATVGANFEGSIDGVQWYVLASTTNVAGDAVFSATKPARFVRLNLTALTGGASPTVTAKFAASH